MKHTDEYKRARLELHTHTHIYPIIQSFGVCGSEQNSYTHTQSHSTQHSPRPMNVISKATTAFYLVRIQHIVIANAMPGSRMTMRPTSFVSAPIFARSRDGFMNDSKAKIVRNYYAFAYIPNGNALYSGECVLLYMQLGVVVRLSNIHRWCWRVLTGVDGCWWCD